MVDDLATRVGEVNARLVAAGRCIMHNSDVDIPARYAMALQNGNVVPLCVECCAWWRQDAQESGDPMSQPVRITELV
jgi:hypothetical protein